MEIYHFGGEGSNLGHEIDIFILYHYLLLKNNLIVLTYQFIYHFK